MLTRSIAMGLGFVFWAVPAAAQSCRLALVLAMDVSSSVDTSEDVLQRQGLANALRSPAVQAAALNGQTVALAVFEWSGRNQQRIVLPWLLLTDPTDLEQAARTIETSVRSHDEFPTALGYALGFASTMLAHAPRCDAKTIDVSGDGINNDGFPPQLAYRHFPLREVTVNGLAILGDMPGLTDYFRFALLRGPGSFVEVADGYADFERAMERKLLRELSSQILGLGSRPADEDIVHLTNLLDETPRSDQKATGPVWTTANPHPVSGAAFDRITR